MAGSDRIRWDQRYAQASDQSHQIEQTPPVWLPQIELELPRQGRALDIAAGAGRLSLWLAARGLDVLAVDISAVGLELAHRAVAEHGLEIETLAVDLEAEPLPPGPFDLITCFNYRQRGLSPAIRERLKPGGFFLAELATVPNLERHAHPSWKYLAEPGELRRDCARLEIVYYQEGWFDDRASARVLARK
jgi:2-polyprenyl-3-methyl-5-hydroxy-6-metoxy-1,4-benzoquinol methylase